MKFRTTRRLVALALASAACIAALPPAAAQTPLKLRITNTYGKAQPPGIALDQFARRVAELSGGSITGVVYHSGTLYSEEKSLRAALDGSIEIGFASLSNWGPFTKALRPYEAPFLYENRAQFRKTMLMGGASRVALEKELAKDGFVPLMVFETGGFRILGTSRPVHSPKDLAGLKIRVPQSAVPLAFWGSLGANATVVPWSETYMALASKAVDGVDTSLPSYPLAKLWEVSKYIALVRYSSVATVVAASTKFWQTLKPEQQKLILQAAREAEQVSVREEDKEESDLLQKLKASGVTLYQPTPAEMAEWKKAGLALWDKLPDTPKQKIEALKSAADQ